MRVPWHLLGSLGEPLPDSRWVHRNGRAYGVDFCITWKVTSEGDEPDVLAVVYHELGQNAVRYGRTVSGFFASFRPAAFQPPQFVAPEIATRAQVIDGAAYVLGDPLPPRSNNLERSEMATLPDTQYRYNGGLRLTVTVLNVAARHPETPEGAWATDVVFTINNDVSGVWQTMEETQFHRLFTPVDASETPAVPTVETALDSRRSAP